MQIIKNIIFDYGNVVFLLDFNKTRTTFTELGISNIDSFFSHAGHDPLFNEYETGRISTPEFRDGVRRILNRPELSDAIIDDTWNSLLIGVPAINHQLLLEAKARYRTFLLSNNNELHLAYIHKYLQEQYGLASNEGFFEKTYYSHLVGMRKPDADIFNLVLNENDLKPEETLFIDDSPQHIRTAAQLGIHTALVTAENTLEQLLKTSKLL